MSDVLARAQALGTPLITGQWATFVYQGERAPLLMGDFTNWHRGLPLTFGSDRPGVWVATVTLPRDAYLEYALLVDGVRQPDPLNRRPVEDGLGHTNSAFNMPAFVETPLITPPPGGLRGTLTAHDVPANGHLPSASRAVQLYQPPTGQPCPLLVVLDGQDFAAKAHLPVIVDNLIAAGQIRPLALALVASNGPYRLTEYACSDATLAFLCHDLLPVAQAHLNLLDPAKQPGTYGIMGASMGGLMSLYAAVRAPEIFGSALIESCAIEAHVPEYRLYYRSVLSDLLAHTPPPRLNLWLDCALHEWFLSPNRRLVATLRQQGHAVAYHEHPSGHNYPSWRNVLWRGLLHLYGSA